jgi:hypothetical protein
MDPATPALAAVAMEPATPALRSVAMDLTTPTEFGTASFAFHWRHHHHPEFVVLRLLPDFMVVETPNPDGRTF